VGLGQLIALAGSRRRGDGLCGRGGCLVDRWRRDDADARVVRIARDGQAMFLRRHRIVAAADDALGRKLRGAEHRRAEPVRVLATRASQQGHQHGGQDA
jgi:hypothetical protein